ncbi:MAG: hypothetical protein KAI22_02520, partial [Gammaproteobacteria bacterium]|nr:hypothetical protein [Gammaproteobacteria bacterium]
LYLVSPKIKIPVKHIVSSALDKQTLGHLKQQLDNLPDLRSLYSNYGSIRFYVGKYVEELIGQPSAFYIAHPDEWHELKDSFLDWVGMDDDTSLFPSWVDEESYVVFGEIPNSGNYFIIPTAGTLSFRCLVRKRPSYWLGWL